MSPIHKQQGAVLIIALVLLLILTLLGISGINLTLLQERMAANAHARSQVFQAAEAALRDGEQDVLDNILPTTVFSANCTNGLCQPGSNGEHVWQGNLIDWATGTNSIMYGQNTGKNALAGLDKQPRYIIERLQVVEPGSSLKQGFDSANQNRWYRITAVGYEPRGKVQAMVQSVYQK